MKTTYQDSIATSILSATEAAQWLSHEYREMARKVITMVECDAQEESTSFTVSITPTASTVVLMSCASVLATLVFRHWHNGFAGVRIDSVYGSACFAIADGSIINL
jgi:archaellum component FlaF (FlaF/FlaG flagellin family)